MQQYKTLYSRVVTLKKRFMPTQNIPPKMASILDVFFTNLHKTTVRVKKAMGIKPRVYTKLKKKVERPTIIKKAVPGLVITVPEYKFIYHIIPKVASSSIKAYISTVLNIPIKDRLTDNKTDSEFKDYYRFTFVRNPWDRVVSCYLNKIMKDESPAGKHFEKGVASFFLPYKTFHAGMDFKDFVREISKIPDEVSNQHFRSQYYKLIGEDGKLLVDFVGRLENIKEDFKTIAKQCNFPSDELPYVNKSRKRKPYSEYYDEETKKLVAERYAKDISLFNYTFGN